MNKRITVRIDERITQLLASINTGRIINLSALVRAALRDKLSTLTGIDNSSLLITLQKDYTNHGTFNI